jgi:uncharacterized secreted protein with C-terminal beta-propeller domain
MRVRVVLVGVLAAASAVPGVADAAPRLKAFASCEALSRYARAHFEQAPPTIPIRREIVPVAAPVEDDHSTTNVQEGGVDEADTVKTDGRRLFAVAAGQLRAIDVRAGALRPLGTLALPEGGAHELLLHGDRLLVLTELGGVGIVDEPRLRPEPLWRPRTLLSEVDVSDPARMRVVRTLEVAGGYVSSRLTGATARVVIASVPTDGAVRPRATLTRAGGKQTAKRAVRCRAVRRPAAFSGLELVTVLTIDLERGLPAVDADAVLAGADTVYASRRSLYVATHRWNGAPTAEIHRFGAAARRETAYAASGGVRGSLLSQWALSEHEGHLRVASTDGAAESHVTVLRERDRRLVEVGRVGGLGKGERIFGVRFLGDAGYVVTFRQTDPLYTLALQDPERPRVLGELKLLGYSAYLHPLGDGLLLGVGQDATEEGRRLGTQLSLFDVSDPRAPRRLHERTLGSGTSSAVEWDHRAFLHWRGLTVLPVDGTAAGFSVGRGGIDPVGTVSQPGSIQRALAAGGRLLTVSEAGVKSSRLATLGGGAWLPFQEGAP